MTCSGVMTWGSDASAPGIGSCVTAFSPSPAHASPVATDDDLGAVLAHSSGVELEPVSTSTLRQLLELDLSPVDDATPTHRGPGRRGSQRM